MTGLTQPWHIILILLIALMVFGGRRLPEIGRSLGTGMREFKDSITSHPAGQNALPHEPDRNLSVDEAGIELANEPSPMSRKHE
jgi:TatA/E family protein of Tat protein translocase